MTVGTVAGRNDYIAAEAHGSVTGAGEAVTINLGFDPTHVIVFNETDAMRWEKFGNMAAANSIKTVTAGTQTLDTNSQVSWSDGVLTLGATLAASGKALKWIARS